jgi:hypothetical protein
MPGGLALSGERQLPDDVFDDAPGLLVLELRRHLGAPERRLVGRTRIRKVGFRELTLSLLEPRLDRTHLRRFRRASGREPGKPPAAERDLVACPAEETESQPAYCPLPTRAGRALRARSTRAGDGCRPRSGLDDLRRDEPHRRRRVRDHSPLAEGDAHGRRTPTPERDDASPNGSARGRAPVLGRLGDGVPALHDLRLEGHEERNPPRPCPVGRARDEREQTGEDNATGEAKVTRKSSQA